MALTGGALLVGGGLVGAAALGTIGAGALYYKYRKMGKRRLPKVASAGLFGGVLDTIDAVYVDDSTGIPKIVHEIFTQIEQSGITTRNIFHATGNVENIKRLELLYNQGKSHEINLYEENTHDLCGLVLHYLQRLPEPLCTLLLYSDFLTVHKKNQEDREQWIKKMKELFNLLPEMNKRLFQRVIEFFDVVGNTEGNNISHSYLAYLLGPILFYDRMEGDEEDGEEISLIYNGEVVYELLMELFQFHSELFPVPLTEQENWDASRKSDLDTRRNSSSDDSVYASQILPELSSEEKKEETEEETLNSPAVTFPSSTNAKKSPQKKRKRDFWKGISMGKIGKQYNVSLAERPPPNTMAVNYVLPSQFSQQYGK